ncbi:hypothetical protein CASFOL_005304 [Castilleja foliolosa]|uniref:Uncharacterized protein n=1 Tax=Castilleja foliolosa TaxID=1961234 RepID=A0ABD3E455_9LAMI
MGTEVLHPQDLFALTNTIINRRPSYNTSHKNKPPRPDKKKTRDKAESGGTKKVTHGCAPEVRRKDDAGLVMGKVTILRRGESLDSLASKISDQKSNPRSPNQKPVDGLEISGTNRIEPELPVMLPNQILLSPPSFPDVFAGLAFSSSPSPCSLPLPSFFKKKEQINDVEMKPSDDPATLDLKATLDLRRMLCLE